MDMELKQIVKEKIIPEFKDLTFVEKSHSTIYDKGLIYFTYTVYKAPLKDILTGFRISHGGVSLFMELLYAPDKIHYEGPSIYPSISKVFPCFHGEKLRQNEIELAKKESIVAELKRGVENKQAEIKTNEVWNKKGKLDRELVALNRKLHIAKAELFDIEKAVRDCKVVTDYGIIIDFIREHMKYTEPLGPESIYNEYASKFDTAKRSMKESIIYTAAFLGHESAKSLNKRFKDEITRTRWTEMESTSDNSHTYNSENNEFDRRNYEIKQEYLQPLDELDKVILEPEEKRREFFNKVRQANLKELGVQI